MKRKIFITILVALLCTLSIGLTACGDKKVTPSRPVSEPEISLDITDARLDVYESLQLTATTANTDAAVEWSSSDPSIATVSGGLVAACSEGTATVTAKAGDVIATCTISVYNSWTAPVLVVDHDQISIAKGGSYTVTANTKWKGNDITNSVEYSWSLGDGENGDIAGLVANGNKATITGKEYGNVEFVVFATVNGVPLVQTVAVKVCNADIVFGVSNLERGAGGYSARLALLKLDDTIIDIIPQITVYDANGVVDGATAQMEWRVEGDAQAVARDEATGRISAVAEGKAQVIGSYENAELVINVTVYRPQISFDNTVYFETSKLLPKTKGVVDPAKPAESGITIEGLQGEVTSAKLGSADILSSYDEGKNLLVINKNNLNTDRSILGETQVLKVDTDKAIYDIAAKVVTLAIRTPADLDSIAAVSADESKYWALKNDSTTEYAPYYWDGYYVLANDIDYMGNQDGHEFVTFIDWGSLSIVKNPDHPDADWVDGRYLGFRGTFDGQGYNIDNFKLKNVDTGGIFGVMATDGVFRNVSFTNAVNPGGTGLICSAGDGTIENVYIQCSSQTGGWNNNRSGMFYTRDIINTAAVKNVFVDTRLTYNDSNTAGNGWIYAFGYAYPSSANYRGVYCVGTEKAYAEKYQGGTWVDNIYGAYNTYTDLRNSGVKFDEWAGDFWTIANGFPFPKKLDIPTVDTTDNKTSITTRSTADGDTVVVMVDKYAIVTLDAESIRAGVKLLGVEQPDSELQQMEFAPVDEDRTVLITVKSAFDSTDAGNKYTVELKAKKPAVPLADPCFDGFEGTGNRYVLKTGSDGGKAYPALSTDDKHTGAQSLKIITSGGGSSTVICLDTDMAKTISDGVADNADIQLLLWLKVASGTCNSAQVAVYNPSDFNNNAQWYLGARASIGEADADGWQQVVFGVEQTREIVDAGKGNGSITVYFSFDGGGVVYVDDITLIEEDDAVTISADDKDASYTSGSSVELATFGGDGFNKDNLTVTCNGSPFTAGVWNGNVLSFAPTAAGEYEFIYTHKNGHKIKTATQRVNLIESLADPCFDSFEGTGNRTVLEAKGDTNEYKLSDEDKLSGSRSLKVTVKNFVSIAIRLDTSMQQAITTSSQLSLWIKVADRATTNFVASAYNADDPSLLGSGRIGLGVVEPGSWRQIIFAADATQDIKNIGAITMYIEFGGQNVGNVFVDDIELIENDGNVTVSAEDMTVKTGVAADIATFGGTGFDASKLTITLNGAAYIDYTINENKLSFTPSAAGEYVFAYTHKNGHAVKTATQTVTAYAPLVDPYFDGFEGTGNAYKLRNNHNPIIIGLTTEEKRSGAQSLKIEVTENRTATVWHLDTDMIEALKNSSQLVLYIKTSATVVCSAYNGNESTADDLLTGNRAEVGADNGSWRKVIFPTAAVKEIAEIGAITLYIEFGGTNSGVAYIDDIEAQKPLSDPTFDGFEGLGNSYAYKTGTVSGEIASWELSQEEKRSGKQSLKLNIPKASSIVLKIDTDMINAIGANSQLSFWLKAPNADSITIGIYKGGDNWNLGSDRITSSETDANGWQKFVFSKETTEKIKSSEEADNSITLYFEFSLPGVAYVDDLQLIEAE